MGFLAEPVLVRRTFGLFRVVTVIISRSFTFNGLISLEFSRNGSLLVRAFLSNLASLVSLYFAFSFSSYRRSAARATGSGGRSQSAGG